MIEKQLKDILEKTFDCQMLIVKNESHLHAGHSSSPGSGESHFTVEITSKDFVGKSRLECHKMVNDAVSSLFSNGLHALSVRTYATQQ